MIKSRGLKEGECATVLDVSNDCLGYRLFETDFGCVALAWNERGLVRVQLPERDRQSTLRRLTAELDLVALEKRPDRNAERAAAKIALHFEGKVQDFRDIAIDLSSCPDFHARVYRALYMVPAGEIVTYAELAKMAGSPRAFRAVGQAMAKNPLAIIVPCHRVVASSGKVGGFSAYGGEKLKKRLLALEHALKEKSSCLV